MSIMVSIRADLLSDARFTPHGGNLVGQHELRRGRRRHLIDRHGRMIARRSAPILM
jgi:hypothetical protein